MEKDLIQHPADIVDSFEMSESLTSQSFPEQPGKGMSEGDAVVSSEQREFISSDQIRATMDRIEEVTLEVQPLHRYIHLGLKSPRAAGLDYASARPIIQALTGLEILQHDEDLVRDEYESGDNEVIQLGPYHMTRGQAVEFQKVSAMTPDERETYNAKKKTKIDELRATVQESTVSTVFEGDAETRLDVLVSQEPRVAVELSKPWVGPMNTSFRSIYNHVPSTIESSQKVAFKEQGKMILEEAGLLQIADKDKSAYAKRPEQAYAQSMWEHLTWVSGIQELPVDPILGLNKNGHWMPDTQHRLERSNINEIPELGGTEAAPITRNTVSETAQSLYKLASGENGVGLLEGKSLTQLYQELTGSKLIDDKYIRDMGELFAHYYGNDAISPYNWKNNTSLIGAFERFTRDSRIIHPVTSKSAHVGVDRGEFDGISHRTPEEIVQKSLQELGIADQDPGFVAEFLVRSASEIPGFLGYAKWGSEAIGTNDYNQMLAIKVMTDVKLWKSAVKRQEWVEGEGEASIQAVNRHFEHHPTEWMVRKYTDKHEQWSIQEIDLPKPDPLKVGLEKPVEALSAWKREDLLYAEGRRLIQEGKIPDSSPTLEHVLTHEMFPIHQTFLHIGLTPEEAVHYFEAEIAEIDGDLPPVEKARLVAQSIREKLQQNPVELRFAKQYEIDELARDAIAVRMMEHISGKEIEPEMIDELIVEVSCGDSRMEASRVGAEQSSDNILTIGAAGHFAIPHQATKEVKPLDLLGLEWNDVESQFWDFIAENHPDANKKDIGRLYREYKDMGVKEYAATAASVVREIYKVSKEVLEVPGNLTLLSLSHPIETTAILATDLSTRILLPGQRRKLNEIIDKYALGESEFDLNPISLYSEEQRETHDQAWQKAEEAGMTPQAYIEYRRVAEGLKTDIKADLVEQFVNSIGFDVNTWQPGKSRMLPIIGHKSTMNENNAFKAAYECGACGGNSGEANAALMAQFINDDAVRTILQERGYNFDGVFAIGGIYDTTLSKTEFHVSDVMSEDIVPLFKEYQEIRQQADDEAVVTHESLLMHKPIDEISVEEARKNAEARSVSWSLTMPPEIGSREAHSLIVGPRQYLRGIRAEDKATTFTINPVNTETLPQGSIDIFSNVYAGIIESYMNGLINRDAHAGKGALSYDKTTGRALRSSGDPEPPQLLPWQVVAGRNIRASRPNMILIEKFANAQQFIEEHPVFKLGYGMATVYDPEEKVWRTFVSESDKKMLGDEEITSSWKVLDHLHDQDVKLPQSGALPYQQGVPVPVRVHASQTVN